MSRPVGGFNRGKRRLLALLKQVGKSRDTDEELGKQLGLGPRQVSRYLSALRDDGVVSIELRTQKFGTPSTFFTTRIIEVI